MSRQALPFSFYIFNIRTIEKDTNVPRYDNKYWKSRFHRFEKYIQYRQKYRERLSIEL